jgi:hypothetical protein
LNTLLDLVRAASDLAVFWLAFAIYRWAVAIPPRLARLIANDRRAALGAASARFRHGPRRAGVGFRGEPRDHEPRAPEGARGAAHCGAAHVARTEDACDLRQPGHHRLPSRLS